MRKILLYLILFLAIAGAVDAGYLLVETMRGAAVVCPNVPVGRFNLNQCNIVLSSSYAKFLGLPTALYGFVVYLVFFILILYEIKKHVYYESYSIQNKQIRWRPTKILTGLSGVGVLISAYFVYLQFFVIDALCFYCLVSVAIMTLIFILSAVYNFKYSAVEGT